MCCGLFSSVIDLINRLKTTTYAGITSNTPTPLLLHYHEHFRKGIGPKRPISLEGCLDCIFVSLTLQSSQVIGLHLDWDYAQPVGQRRHCPDAGPCQFANDRGNVQVADEEYQGEQGEKDGIWNGGRMEFNSELGQLFTLNWPLTD